MKPEDIVRDPDCVSKRVVLSSGDVLFLRPLCVTDAALLGTYFLSLSEQTKIFYGPHPFDQKTADQLCAETASPFIVRMVGVLSQRDQQRIVAYFILKCQVGNGDQTRYANRGMLLTERDCSIAPSVADDLQNSGIGSVVMAHMMDVARLLGKQRMILQGGVQQPNVRGVHFYKKFGFQVVAAFTTRVDNYDMMVDLLVV